MLRRPEAGALGSDGCVPDMCGLVAWQIAPKIFAVLEDSSVRLDEADVSYEGGANQTAKVLRPLLSIAVACSELNEHLQRETVGTTRFRSISLPGWSDTDY